jgi:hypothetical protein
MLSTETSEVSERTTEHLSSSRKINCEELTSPSNTASVGMSKTVRPVAVADAREWVLFEKKQGTVYCVGSLTMDGFSDSHCLVCAVVDQLACATLAEPRVYSALCL